LNILSKLIINKLESKLIIFVFSIANVFIVKAINRLKIVVLFEAKEALIKYVKSGLLALSNSLVCFSNNYLWVNQRNEKYYFLYYSLD